MDLHEAVAVLPDAPEGDGANWVVAVDAGHGDGSVKLHEFPNKPTVRRFMEEDGVGRNVKVIYRVTSVNTPITKIVFTF